MYKFPCFCLDEEEFGLDNKVDFSCDGSKKCVDVSWFIYRLLSLLEHLFNIFWFFSLNFVSSL